MIQTPTERTAQAIARIENTAMTEVSRLLENLSRDLDNEICEALNEENNGLAERLNRHFIRTKKLAKTLRQSSDVTCSCWHRTS